MDLNALVQALAGPPQPTAKEHTAAHSALINALAGPIGRIVGFPKRYTETYQPGQSVRDNPAAADWGAEMALNMVGTPGGVGGMGSGARFKSAKELADFWSEQGIRNFVADRPARGQLQLSDLVVPQEKRGQGIGSQFMKDLTALADESGRVVTLTPDVSYGASSLSRLKEFYKRFGFLENRGRNIDHAISDSMYRPLPKK